MCRLSEALPTMVQGLNAVADRTSRTQGWLPTGASLALPRSRPWAAQAGAVAAPGSAATCVLRTRRGPGPGQRPSVPPQPSDASGQSIRRGTCQCRRLVPAHPCVLLIALQNVWVQAPCPCAGFVYSCVRYRASETRAGTPSVDRRFIRVYIVCPQPMPFAAMRGNIQDGVARWPAGQPDITVLAEQEIPIPVSASVHSVRTTWPLIQRPKQNPEGQNWTNRHLWRYSYAP